MCEIGKEVPSIATSATHRPSFNPSSVDEFQTTSSSGFYSSVTGTTSSTQGTTLSLDLKPNIHLNHPLQPLLSPQSKPTPGAGGGHNTSSGNTHLSPLSLVLQTPEHRSSFDSVLSISGNGAGGNSPPITSGTAGTGKRLSLEQFFLIQQQQQSIMCEQFVQACNASHPSSASPGKSGLYPQNTGEKRHSTTFATAESPEHGTSSTASERKTRKNSLFFRKRRESQTTPTNTSKTLITTIEGATSPSRSTSPNLIVYVDDYTSTACSSCFYEDDYDDETIDEEDEERRKFERRKSRIDFISGIPDIEEEAETNLEEEVVVIDDELNGGDYEIELIIDEDDLVSSIGHVNKSASVNNLPLLPGVEAATSNRKCSNSAPEIVIIPDGEGGNSIELTNGDDYYEMKESKPDVPDIGPEMAAGIAAARRASRCMEGPCVIEIIHNTNAGRRKRSIVLRPPGSGGSGSNGGGPGTAGSNNCYDNKGANNGSSSRRSSAGSQISPNSSLPVALVQLASETANRTTTTAIKKVRKTPRVRIRKLRFGKGDQEAKLQKGTLGHNANGTTIRRTHRRHRDSRHESKAAKTLTIITGKFFNFLLFHFSLSRS